METDSAEPSRSSWIMTAVMFLVHQITATYIAGLTARLVIGGIADLLWPFGIRIHQTSVAMLTSPPYFPLQIIWALFLGWSLSGFLRQRTMLWVWVVPTALLAYLFSRFPYRPAILSPSAYLYSPSALTHFFGRPCIVGRSCVDQAMYTFPFLTAAAYSLGALLARRMNWLSRYAAAMADVNLPRASLIGGGYVLWVLIFQWRRLSYIRFGPTWLRITNFAWTFLLAFAFVTYIFMVVISLIGPRFALTRWFLHQHEPPMDAPRTPPTQFDA